MPRKRKTVVEEEVVTETTENLAEEEAPEMEEGVEEEPETVAVAESAAPSAPVLITTDVNTLRQALELLMPVVPRKATLPVLTNVLLSKGMAIATDLETMVMVAFPDAEGECLLPARKAGDLLKYVAGFQPLTIEYRKPRVSLTWDGGKATYDVPSPNDYPDVAVPDITEDSQAYLDGQPLVSALVAALGYCSTDQARPVLAGVTLYLGEKIRVAGADGFRLSYQELNLSFPTQATAIIPAKSVEILEFLWKRVPPAAKPVDDLIAAITAKRQLHLGIADGKIVMGLPKVNIVSKLIEGTPPNFEQLVPKNEDNSVLIMGDEFERGLRRLADIANDSKGVVRLSWGNSKMSLAAKTADSGEMETSISAITDQPGKIAIDIGYLLGYLKGKTGLVKMVTTNPTSPALLLYKDSPKVVIMPMNIQ